MKRNQLLKFKTPFETPFEMMSKTPFKISARGLVGAAAVVAATSAVAFAASNTRLIMNGKTASVDVRTIGGKTYVPIGDVAKALGMVVVRSGNGYEIKKAGGTYQVQDLSGRIGDTLFDGKWRLRVLNIQTPPSFQMRTEAQPYGYDNSAIYNMKTRVITPRNGYKLVVLQVRISNGQKTTQTLWTSISDKNMRTALADEAGQSFAPINYDYDGAPTVTQPMIPGASQTFPIIFSVPQSTVLKDFVMTLKNNDYSARGNDARVALPQ